ncbi:tartrate-resistant acid phosphatase type 5 family protein [Sphingomonas sp.]|uniref:purple acid phosphatase family protein n=1 Tax=Sphingomonas sp. TaxID=28214 RepID=UPI001D78D0C7|nr:tartrate-resistant acid phosphatase type 5 family protein [Sphingomonas sp.]MBX9796798.1 metallophosphoesterase [Sphingomonas sp.]
MRIDRRAVMGGLAAGAVAPLVPAQAAGKPLNFLVVGDWGRDGAEHQRDVAVQMGKTASASRARFVASVGDNFYDDGVDSITDPQWASSFERVYTDPSLQVPWFVTLGNHDYRGNPQAQLDYARVSKRWRLPARYYTVPGASLGLPEADFFFIDTSPMVNKYRDNVKSRIAQNVAQQDVRHQLAWLDAALSKSRAAWKIVMGHHTIRSGGSGHGDTPEMVAMVKPILERHGVQAYIAGHDHDLQHIVDNGVDYVLCGAGSEVRPVAQVAGTRFALARSGFGAFSLTRDTLALEFRDYLGASVYQAQIAREVRAKAA